MADEAAVAAHYDAQGLLAAIREGLERSGKTPEGTTVEDLAPVDEFHIGGRQASEDFLGQLGLSAEHHVLDVGSGLGGPARYTARRWGARVTGIDLTAAFVETGRVLTGWVGLDERVALHQGSALATGFEDAAFDAAYMLHVGMNIADKESLARSMFRALRPGGVFGIYDVMRIGPGELRFPLPWASAPAGSAVETPEAYRHALEAAGFRIEHERERRAFAIEFFETLQARTAAREGPPPLGLHLLMGPTAAEKVGNMIDNIAAGRIAPVELVARRPG